MYSTLIIHNDVTSLEIMKKETYDEISVCIYRSILKIILVIFCFFRVCELQAQDANVRPDSIENQQGHSMKADILHKEGINYYKKGDLKNALISFRVVLGIREKILPLPHKDFANSLYLIGLINGRLDNHQACLDTLQLALSQYELLDSPKGLRKCHHELGKKYTELEDSEFAQKHLKQALPHAEEEIRQAITPKDIAKSQMWCANVLLDLADTQQTLGFYNESEASLRKSIKLYNESGSEELYKAYNGLGFLFDEQGKKEEALEAYQKGLGELGNEVPNEQSKFLNNIGEVQLDLGNLELAEKFFQQSLVLKKQIQEVSIHPSYNSIYHNLAFVYWKRKEYDKAIQFLHQAIECVVPNYEYQTKEMHLPNPVYVIGGYQNLMQDLGPLGQICLEAYQKTQKAHYLKLAFQASTDFLTITSLLRDETMTEGATLHWLEKFNPYVESCIKIAFIQYTLTPSPREVEFIFNMIEENKSVILLNQIRAQQKNTQDLPLDVLNIKNDIADIQTQLLQDVSPFTKDSLDALLNRLEIEKETWRKKIKNQKDEVNEKSWQLYSAEGNGSLDENQALLNYFWGDSAIYVVLDTRMDDKVFQIAHRDIEYSILQLLDLLREPSIQENQTLSPYKKFAEYSYALGSTLLIPALKHLPPNVEDIIISPSGILHYLPFEVLLTKRDTISNSFLDNPAYFMNEFDLNYTYSANMLVQNHNEIPANGLMPLLAVAPHFKNYDTADKLRSCNGQLSQLTFNKEEVESIQSIIGGELLVGQEAIKKDFLNMSNEAQIIHLATHACFDPDDPQNSRFFLSDEPVFLHEVYSLSLPSQMVVLSACETGLGELKVGEGVMSLSRAFAYAGVPSTTMSLWSVNDESTQRIMNFYYEELSQKIPKHKALNKARKRYLNTLDSKKFFHPFYWAAFVHYGDTDNLSIAESSSWNKSTWVLGIFVLLAGGIWWWKGNR